jgi:hypothetical protein
MVAHRYDKGDIVRILSFATFGSAGYSYYMITDTDRDGYAITGISDGAVDTYISRKFLEDFYEWMG